MKIGFIGMGNMALALAKGFADSGKVEAKDMYAYAPNQEKLKKNAEVTGFNAMSDIVEMVREVQIVIMACKPYQIDEVLAKVGDELKEKALVSVAAGWVHESFASKLGLTRIQCIMPNTPAMVGEGVMLFEETNSLNKEELDYVKDIFSSLGIVEVLPTRLMGIGGAVSGCGPAFMDLMMEAYADAAVKYGIQRAMAYRLAAQTMLGSAKLALESGQNPAALKDAVCSPAGTTIRGVAALEEWGFRNACIKSIDAIMEKK